MMKLKNFSDGTVLTVTIWVDDLFPKKILTGWIEEFSDKFCFLQDDGRCTIVEWDSGEVKFIPHPIGIYNLRRSDGVKVFQMERS